MTIDRTPAARLRFGPFALDVRAAELTNGPTRVGLPPQPVRILALLAQRPGQLVTRQEIQRAIWGQDTHVDFDRALNFAVKQIREALSDDAEAPRYVETLRGRGYRFIADVAIENGAPNPAPEGVEPMPAAVRVSNRRMRWAVAAAVAIAAVVWFAFSRSGLGADRPAIRSIVVLPIANLSGNAERDYLADAMTDGIIGSLSHIESLRVISRTSALVYKNAKKTIPEIARELNVDAVMEGTFEETSSGLQLTLTVRDNGEQLLWSSTFARGAAEMAAIQYEVARDVATRIGVPIPSAIAGHMASSRPVDPRVYQAYARGRYFWNRRSKEDVQRALAEFSNAIEIDPAFAPAYAGLADSYSSIGSYGFAAGEQAWRQSVAAAEKALLLDPNLADGHTSRATIAVYYEWDWERAGGEYRRALQLNPGYATARHWYGYYQLLIGKPREAEAEITAALRLDPLSPIINANIGFCRYIARDYDGALSHLRGALEMHPEFRLIHSYIGLVHVARGAYEEAIAAFLKALETGGAPTDRAVLAHAYARAGQTDRAKAILAELERPKGGEFLPAYYFALVHVGLGDKDRAFAALDRAFEERVGPLNELNIDPMFDSLRDDPRFDTLRRRLRLR